MAPQRPRPPQPGRPASPRRPATPRPAPARDAGDGGRGTARRAAAPSATPERIAPDGSEDVFLGSDETTAALPTTGPRTSGTARTGTTPATGAARAGSTPATSTPRASSPPRAESAATRARSTTRATTTAAGDSTPGTPRRTAGSAVDRTAPRTPARTSGRATGRGLTRSTAAPRTPAGGVVAQGSAARFAERARAHRRLTQRRILIVLGALVAAGGLAWLLFFSPVLALHAAQVQVTGADSVVAVDQVRAVVDARDRVPLPRLDTAALRSELLEVPGVRDATVTREWPHGLSVALVAREPVAAVPEGSDVAQSAEGTPTGTGFALVDEEGVQVGRADEAPEGLPVVEVPVGEERVLSAVLGVLEQLPADLLAQVGQVSATTQDSVNFTLRDGAAVEWGSSQDSALKAAVLSALRAAPETAGSTRYDVSAPTMPVVG
ncbi:cell division protein FtsQ/DivIB [Cellulomonas taurus]|uniref:cell division protein FtsQ/DivIB n=1 Tax=Cellulomonas taurus TaxID=2729175 RepID=UPI001FE3BCB8|nr:cell division protein FtsQ/DivIB [Cellulomonas taurus]